MAQEQWTSGDLTFDVRVGGPTQGDPVLLLHGFPQNSAEWGAVSSRLHAAGYQTIAPDQRGYSPGARPTEVEAYRMERLVEDVIGLLDSRGLDSVHLVGHDWGAAVAWSVAATHPERVRTLTALSVPHPAAFATAIRTDREQRRKSKYMLFFRRAGVSEKALLAFNAQLLRSSFKGAGITPTEVATYVDPLKQPGALTAALSWYRAMSGRDSATTKPVTVPTTFVWSTEDVAIGRAGAATCGLYVEGDYRFVELDGLSHWLADEAPDRIAEIILDRITR
jgi:pimeloyl-ACP methyl ester carboxylesterase